MFNRYQAIKGDRWDTIAAKFRNDPYDYVDIIQANPTYQGEAFLPVGAVISVPVKEVRTVNLIPPWER